MWKGKDNPSSDVDRIAEPQKTYMKIFFLE